MENTSTQARHCQIMTKAITVLRWYNLLYALTTRVFVFHQFFQWKCLQSCTLKPQIEFNNTGWPVYRFGHIRLLTLAERRTGTARAAEQLER
jgi:hypothetical protein